MNTIQILDALILPIRIIPALTGNIIQHLVMLRHTGRNSLPKQISLTTPSKVYMEKQVKPMRHTLFPGGLIRSSVHNMVFYKTTLRVLCIDGGMAPVALHRRIL